MGIAPILLVPQTNVLLLNYTHHIIYSLQFNYSIKHGIGFEPTNNSFADYPLRPLEYPCIIRKKRDSNPRAFRPTVFRTASINHSDILPYTKG